MIAAWGCLVLVFALGAAPSAPEPAEVEVERLDAEPVRGALTALDAQGVTLRTADGERRVAFDAILAITPKTQPEGAAGEPRAFVETVDGSNLPVGGATCDAQTATLELLNAETLSLNRGAVRAVRFTPLDDALAAQWDKLVESADAADRVVVNREGQLDYLEGVVEEIGPEKVTFRLEDEVRRLSKAKLTGILFHRAAGSKEGGAALGRLYDRRGAVVAVADARLEGGRLRVTTPAGWSAAWDWRDVRRLDFSVDKLVNLTDLNPERNEFSPDPLWTLPGSSDTLRAAFGPRFDSGFEQGPLVLDGRDYARGIALRGRSQLTYRLPEGYRTFTAQAGIDDRVRPRGDAVLTIRADEKPVCKLRLTGREGAQAISAPIEGAHRLTVVVESGQMGDVADVVLLVNPRLSK